MSTRFMVEVRPDFSDRSETSLVTSPLSSRVSGRVVEAVGFRVLGLGLKERVHLLPVHAGFRTGPP